MNAPLYHIAVLITVHNRCQQTLSCLRELFKQSLPDGYALEVFLTDDGCTDGTPQVVREHYPQVHIIPGDGSLYWNRGMWTAWNAASHHRDYDFYLWLNDDTLLSAKALQTLFGQDKAILSQAILVGATEDSTHSGQVSYGGRVGDNRIIPSGALTECDSFNGNIVLIPSQVFQVVGNLDPYYRHSKGDFDYGRRARRVGFRCYQVGEFLGVCDRHERLDRWCDPTVPLSDRWMYLHQPTGMAPHEMFHLEKQDSLMLAAVHFFTIYIRCLFPSFWIKVGKAKI